MSDIIALKDLCEIDITDGTHKTPTYSNEGFIFLSSKNVTSGKIDWEDIMYIPQWLHDELYKRIAPKKDDILLAKNGTTGVAAIVDKDEIFDIYVSLALIRPDKRKILPRYLLHAINSEPSKKFFDSHLKGIGVPNLHLTHIRETPINVPSFAQQQYIIDILDKLESNISLRKQQLSKLDELVKSRFIELFGDNVPTAKLGDVCRMINGDRGKNYPSGDDFVENGVPFVNAGHLQNRKVDFCDMNYITEEKFNLLSQGKMQAGDILYCLRGSLGKHGLVDFERGAVASSLVILRCNQEQVLPQFLLYALETPEIELQLKAANNGSSQPNLSAASVKAYDIKLPTIEQQKQFVSFVEQTDKSKFEIQKSLEKLETLKKALMQKYFGANI